MTSPVNGKLHGRFTAFDADSVTVARLLIGQRLVRRLRGQRLAGTIVEVEAYLGAVDKAAHTYNGRRTPRNESMYQSGGHLYVYFTYGMHHCVNVVCGQVDEGVAVLIRALEPTEGLEIMRKHRPNVHSDTQLCSGPARLTKALDIDRRHDGIDLRRDSDIFIERLRKRSHPDTNIAQTPRIGVAYAEEWADKPLRFCLRGNPHLSRHG